LLGRAVPLAEGSSSPNDRPHLRLPERSKSGRQRWGRSAEDRRQHQPSPPSYRRGSSFLRTESNG
jgi:hypothetical protein